MLMKILLLAAISMPNQALFENNGISISAEINSNIYTYRITNQNNSPVTQFEIEPHACYNFTVPKGWEFEESSESFKAWATSEFFGIKGKKTGEFSMRVSSKGAVVGLAPAKVQLASGESINLSAVWTPHREPKSHIVLVSTILLSILILHTVLTTRKASRSSKEGVTHS